MTIADRTRWIVSDILQKQGLTETGLYRRLGIRHRAPSGFPVIDRAPSAEFISTFCRTFNINPRWMVTGEGKPYRTEFKSETPTAEDLDTEGEEVQDADPDAFFPISLVDSRLNETRNALLRRKNPPETYSFRKSWLRRIAGDEKNIALAPVFGDQMTPTLTDGDRVLIDTGENRLQSGRLHALAINGFIMVKRLEAEAGGSIRMINDNYRKYPSRRVTPRHIRILGVVVWLIRPLA